MPEHAQLAVCHLFLDDRILRGEPCDDPVDAQILVVSGNDFLCRTTGGVEENEVLDSGECLSGSGSSSSSRFQR